MASLVDLFRRDIDKMKDVRMEEAIGDVAYSTGFLALDFLNGSVVHVKSDTQDFKYNSVGIVDGAATTVIGRSGCGKSTIILQMAANIVRPFKNSGIWHDDIEGGMNDARKSIIMDMSEEEIERRYVYRNAGITAENFYQRIKMIHDMKLNNRADFEYDTGLYNPKGKRIFKFVPSVYILDSLTMLLPEKITEEEELSGQMSVTSGAKVNTRIFRQIVPMLKAANIILLVINHILDDVNINPFQRTKAQVAWLKPGERLPGGKAAIYLANNMFRMDDNTKLKESDGLGIDGSIVDIQIVKSRTNKSGKSIPVVFNMSDGKFDYELSLFHFLKSTNRIISKGNTMNIDGTDIKFSQKQFKDKLYSDPEFSKVFTEICYEELCKLLSASKESNDIEKVVGINDVILGFSGISQNIA